MTTKQGCGKEIKHKDGTYSICGKTEIIEMSTMKRTYELCPSCQNKEAKQ